MKTETITLKLSLTPDNPNFTCCLVLYSIIREGKLVIINPIRTIFTTPSILIISILIDYTIILVTNNQSRRGILLKALNNEKIIDIIPVGGEQIGNGEMRRRRPIHTVVGEIL